MNNDYPIYNGIAPSWADFSLKISGTDITLIEMKDISAVNTSRTVEVGEQRGASGGRVMSRTTGSSSQEASVTLYKSGLIQLYRGLLAAAPVRGNQKVISLVHFDMHLQWTPAGSVEIFDRRVKGCRVIGDTMNGAEGTDADQVEVPLSVIQIVDMVDGFEVVLL
jgi:hypothetical protein